MSTKSFGSAVILCFGLSVLTTSLSGQPVQAELLGHWEKSGLVGSSFYNNTYNEVWGLAYGGREYGIIGSTAGTHFIDITDPTQPEEVAFVAGALQGGNVVHRDFHNYGCYLYAVCDEGASTLQIIDFSTLPDSVSVVYDSNELIRRSHNIFIDTLRAKLYCLVVANAAQGYHAMRVYDLADPLNPTFIGAYNKFGNITASQVHDAYVEDGIAYLNCGPHGLAIVDFTDPANPVTLGTLTDYPFKGYNHSGWLAADRTHYIMSDEDHGFEMKMLDVSDPSDIQVVKTFNAGSESSMSIPHNQIIACNFLYVSYYYDGLQVYDISDPESPVRVMYYPTSQRPYSNSYEGAWGVYPFLPSGNVLVSDMQRGLFIIRGPGDDCPAREASIVDCNQISGVGAADVAPLPVVYPVPARSGGQVYITGWKGQQKVNAVIADVQGRHWGRFELTGSGESLRLDLPGGLPVGVYFLELTDGKNRWVDKLIIQ